MSLYNRVWFNLSHKYKQLHALCKKLQLKLLTVNRNHEKHLELDIDQIMEDKLIVFATSVFVAFFCFFSFVPIKRRCTKRIRRIRKTRRNTVAR